MNALNTLFLDLLADCYHGEQCLALVMPVLAKQSTCKALQKLMRRHHGETRGHVKKVERIFALFDVAGKSGKCDSIYWLLQEMEETLGKYKASTAINAAFISCVQKIEHREIATYGCLAEWAACLGNKEAASLLREILAEEKATDQALSYLARSSANDTAFGGGKANNAPAAARIAKPFNRRSGLRPRTFNGTHPVLM